MESLAGLEAVPRAAALEYSRKSAQLLQEVNAAMSRRPDLDHLIGEAPRSMMFDNHHNHVVFMSNVFLFNAFELLARIVPWVYRTYRNHGFSHDYFPAALEAWMASLEANLGPRAQPMARVYRWMLDHHEDFIRISQSHTSRPAGVKPEWEDCCHDFVAALLSGDMTACWDLFHRKAPDASGYLDFCLEVVQPAMYRIGYLWERDDISVAEEHLASSMVTRLLAAPPRLATAGATAAGKAIVSAAPNEFHEIGAWIVARALEAAGWRVLYLGGNAPAEDLGKMVAKEQPDLLALSMAMPFNLDKVASCIEAARGGDAAGRLKIMVGGLGFALQPSLAEKVGSDGYAPDARAAARLAGQWFQGSGQAP
jgi:methanogenic corrinoid protein MtbC1